MTAAAAGLRGVQLLEQALSWLLAPWCAALLALECGLCGIAWRAGRALIPAPWSLLGATIATWALLILLTVGCASSIGNSRGMSRSNTSSFSSCSSRKLAAAILLAAFNCGLSAGLYMWLTTGAAFSGPQLQPDFPWAVAAMRRLIAHPEADGHCEGGLQLHEDRLCSRACGGKGGSSGLGGCFHRLRNMCVAADCIRLCQEDRTAVTDQLVAHGQFVYDHVAFSKTRHKDGWLPFVYRSCEGLDLDSISGLVFIAAEANRANPYHEGEKILTVISAVGWQRLRARLFWYTSQDRTTPLWSGALDAIFGSKPSSSMGNGSSGVLNWRSIPTSGHDTDQCYRDAIMLDTPASNVPLPGTKATHWFRKRIFAHCGVARLQEAATSKRQLVVLDRSSSRHFANRC